MKNLFTLIELIVVIAVLGILAAIIIPNISSFQEEANETAIQSNVRNLQTSVDMYGLENYGAVPTADIPLEDVPQPIDFNKVYPDYTRDLPETEGVKYWVDFQGKVWASTIDSPSDVTYNPGTLEWTGVENAAYYNIFKVVDNNASSSIKNKKTIFVKKLEDSSPTVQDTTLPNLKTGEQYLVSAIDKQGFESAPAGTNYNGYVEVPFVSGQSSEPQQDAIIPVGTIYEFTNAGATGSYGPNQTQINSAYTNTSLDGKVTSNNGVQSWIVPETGTYSIATYGARGGLPLGVSDSHRGLGVKMKGDFMLTQGEVIQIVVGQEGTVNTTGNTANGGGAGGGASFVWKDGQNTPLIAAGGGGGGSITNTSYNIELTKGRGGNTTTNGQDSWGENLNNHGVNGGNATYSNGAKGWNHMISNGFIGVSGGGYGAKGGFGGGGLGSDSSPHAGGGGGGYSGGGGGKYVGSGSTAGGNGDGRDGGGGGGSYNAGTNQVNSTGNNNGHGKVIITRIN